MNNRSATVNYWKPLFDPTTGTPTLIVPGTPTIPVYCWLNDCAPAAAPNGLQYTGISQQDDYQICAYCEWPSVNGGFDLVHPRERCQLTMSLRECLGFNNY